MCNREIWKAFTAAMFDQIADTRAEVAKRMNVTATDVCRWANAESSLMIPLDHLLDANELSDDFFLKELARIRGYELVPTKAKQADVAAADLAFAGLVQAVGEANNQFVHAKSDGVLTPREKRQTLHHANVIASKLNMVNASLT